VTVRGAARTWELRKDSALTNKEKTISGNIETKLVVITDANSGVGENPAHHLAKLGAMLVQGRHGKDRFNANC
jgi:hypothetical protein